MVISLPFWLFAFLLLGLLQGLVSGSVLDTLVSFILLPVWQWQAQPWLVHLVWMEECCGGSHGLGGVLEAVWEGMCWPGEGRGRRKGLKAWMQGSATKTLSNWKRSVCPQRWGVPGDQYSPWLCKNGLWGSHSAQPFLNLAGSLEALVTQIPPDRMDHSPALGPKHLYYFFY